MDKNEMTVNIEKFCKELKLSQNFSKRAVSLADGNDEKLSYLYQLMDAELVQRSEKHRVQTLRESMLPCVYEPDKYDASEIEFGETNLQQLLKLDFYKEGKNLILYGNTGTGKTMLAILIGLAACQRNISVRFYRTKDLISEFAERARKGTVGVLLNKLQNTSILILDEFGFVSYDPDGARELFDYISALEYDRQHVVIVTTNLDFQNWVEVLHDPKMTPAFVGRLTKDAYIILYPGRNRRMDTLNAMQSYLQSKGSRPRE